MTLTALFRHYAHGLMVLAARIFPFWKYLHLTKGHAIYWDFNAL